MILFIIYLVYIAFYYENISFFIVFWGAIFFAFYVYILWLYHKKSHKISEKKVSKYILKIEKRNTYFSFWIYILMIFWLFFAFQKWYINFDFTLSWFVIPYWIILIIFHDTYFFFLHRFLHTKFMYKYVHKYHHASVHPSAWSAYNFHPVEAVLYTFAAIPIFFVDINIYALFFAIFYNDLLNFLGHSGYELFEKKPKNIFLKYVVLVTYHDLHHSHNKGNFALYFSWWDKLFGTYDKKYDEL